MICTGREIVQLFLEVMEDGMGNSDHLNNLLIEYFNIFTAVMTARTKLTVDM